MRLVIVLLLAGCVDDSLRIVFESETQTVAHELNGTFDHRALGVGIAARFVVVKGDGEDEHTPFAANELAIRTLAGATPCDGLCVVADGSAPVVELEVDTPEGVVRARRNVATRLKLSVLTPNWGRAPVDHIHVRANARNPFWPILRDATNDALVVGMPPLEIAGPLVVDGPDVMAGAPGTATVGAPNVAPLRVKIVTDADSLASIVRFAADRVWTDGRGRDTLTAYTEGPVGNVLFDGFDAEDYLVLRDLPLEVVGGPGVEPQVPCRTNHYCFLRGRLSDRDELMSHVDVRAGAGTRRFPVRVIRGEY